VRWLSAALTHEGIMYEITDADIIGAAVEQRDLSRVFRAAAIEEVLRR